MATFSIGEAAKSGFRIIREHPKAILVWSLAYFVMVLVPQVLMAATMTPDLTTAEGAALEAIEARAVPLQLVQVLCGFVWALLFYGAIYRVVLEPNNSSRWYMRLGKQEFWIGVVSAVGMVMLILAALGALIPVFIASTVALPANGNMSIGGSILMGLVFLLCFVPLVWVSIRLSLAPPLSFEKRKFLLFASWPLTRGHAWRIWLASLAAAGLSLLVSLAFFGVLLVLGLLAAAVAGLAAVAGGETLEAFLARGPVYWWPASVLVFGALLSVWMTVTYTVAAAPSATIYRRLAAATEPARAA